MRDPRSGGTCPFGASDGPAPSRRGLLLGASLAGGAAMFGRAAQAQAPATPLDPAPHDFENDGTRERQPFYGPHQSGIANPQPASAIFVAFDVLASDRADLQRLFKTLTDRIVFLMHGGETLARNPQMPPPDSGILGPQIYPDNLTITVALGASLFDARYGLAELKPKHLVAMEQFPNDALEADKCHGDLLIQFCANTAETNIHALRDIIRATPDLLAARWKMDGFLPPHTLKKLGKDTVRNLLGFKDGTSNLDPQDRAAMDELVWVGDAHGEPSWATGGSYQVVRFIHITAERWDRTPLGEQQTIIGREKMSGAPLGMAKEHDVPDYAGAQGKTIPMDAHIRLANPRTAATRKNLILRRPYNFSRDSISKAGQLEMGLAFCCFQSDLDAGFRAVQTRLNGEPLEEYIKPFGGGYFFALPGAKDADDYLGKSLVERRPA